MPIGRCSIACRLRYHIGCKLEFCQCDCHRVCTCIVKNLHAARSMQSLPTDETWDESYAREFLSDLKVGSTPATQLRIRNIPVNKL